MTQQKKTPKRVGSVTAASSQGFHRELGVRLPEGTETGQSLPGNLPQSLAIKSAWPENIIPPILMDVSVKHIGYSYTAE